MGIDLRWFTGVRVPPSICFHEALGHWAQSQSLDRFGSKLGLRVGAPDLTGVGDISVSGAFNTAVFRAAFEWIYDVPGFQAVDTMGVWAGGRRVLRPCG